jgi:response regulator RpfG family c-di-GMP phosphodiesterase
MTALPAPENPKVLVVDDNEQNRQLCTDNLLDENYEVIEAVDGREAIDLARAHNPDVILMDVMMPGMNGLDATRMLKHNAKTRHIPIILLTAKGGSEEVIEGLEAGADEYVTKPIHVAELLARVRAMARLKSALDRAEQLTTKLSDLVDEQTDRLQLLYEFATRLSGRDSLNDALESAVRAAARATNSGRVSIMLPDETGQSLTIAHSIGIDPEIVHRVVVPMGARISGRVFTENTLVVIDSQKDLGELGHEYVSRAFVSLPIVSTSMRTESGPVGVLNVTDRLDGKRYTPEEIDCLRSIADTAAVAIQNHLRRIELDQSRDATIIALAKLAESRDACTGNHLERVQHYCRILGNRLSQAGPYRDQVTPQFISDLIRSAPLHDIGKVALPDAVLLKPGKLSAEEYARVKEHARIGADTLRAVAKTVRSHPFLQMGVDVAQSHHEKFDGSGYPDGLVGQDIPLSARIVAVADAYDAITTVRPYKQAVSHEEAVRRIREGKGRHFDPAIVNAFEQCLGEIDSIRQKLADLQPSLPPY